MKQQSQTNTRQEKYWAFISYSHKDDHWAVWLRQALLDYKIPASLLGQTSTWGPIPARFDYIFRDKDEAAAGSSLDQVLKDRLKESRNLIVICSPESANSVHVNEEVKYFKSLGRAENILCMIVDGRPDCAHRNLDTAQECFCPAIIYQCQQGEVTGQRGSTPLAADVRLMGEKGIRRWLKTRKNKQLAIQKLVAGMLGTGVSEITHQFKRKQLHSRLAAAALAGLIITAVYQYLDNTIWVSQSYYKDYVRTQLGWLGIDKTSLQAQQLSYRFTRQGEHGPLLKVELLNNYNRCPSDGIKGILGEHFETPCSEIRACEVSFKRDVNGDISQEVYKDHQGYVIETLDYKNPNLAQFTENGLGCTRSPSGISYIGFEWSTDINEQGRLRQMLFYNQQNKLRKNKKGHVGYQYLYERQGRLSTKHQLNAEQSIDSSWLYSYDDRGNRTSEANVNSEFKPLSFLSVADRTEATPRVYSNYVYKTQYIFDDKNNNIERRYFNSRDQLTYNKHGYAILKIEYDDKHEVTRVSYFDPQGKPVLYEAYASFNKKYDAQGNYIEVNLLNEHAKLSTSEDGYAIRKARFNGLGYKVEESYYDAQLKPVEHKKGYATLIKEYDERGNHIAYRYLDLQGSPLKEDGMLKNWRKTYNSQNLMQSETSYSLDDAGKAVIAQVLKRSYDANGNLIRSSNYDANAKPILNKHGYSSSQYEYDSEGNEIAISYFDAEGNLTMDKGSYARVRYAYKNNIKVKTSYYNTSGQLTLLGGEYALVRYTIDAKGNETQRAFYNAADEPTWVKSGQSRYSFYRKTYDKRGKRTSLSYYGIDGEPVVMDSGYHRIEYTFNEKGQEVKLRYLDSQLKPVKIDSGYAGFTRRYNLRGQVRELRYIDEDGQFTINNKGYAGYINRYDSHGKELTDQSHYIDTSGQIIETREVITEVAENTQASRIGLKPGDIIYSTSGQRVYKQGDFKKSSPEYELKILRQAKIKTFRVKDGRLGINHTSVAKSYIDQYIQHRL